MTVIIVSGTPGTGKTFLSKRLANTLKFKYLDVKKLISKNKLKESYDKKRKSWIIDEKKLAKTLERLITASKDSLIIDSHLTQFINPQLIDLCIITKCDLKTLEKRLKKKKYNKNKIRENLDCEIFDICLNEAKEKGHKILIADTTKTTDIAKFAKKVKTKMTK